jgi:phosphatidate cytidylyltransferase
VPNGYGLLGLASSVSLLATWEFLKLAGIDEPIHRFAAITWGIVLWIATYFQTPLASIGAMTVPLIGLLMLREKKMEGVLEKMAKWIMSIAYCIVPLILAYKLCFHPDGTYEWQFPMGVIFLNYLADTAAYITGRWIGKHPFSPIISPKKTWEGVIGGFVFVWIAAIIFHLYLPSDSYNWLALATIISFFNQPGDLIESLLKRSSGQKDSGGLIPGHGGILDRIDNLLIIFPLIYCYQSLRFS